MVELGNPFSKPYQELIAALEQSLREGVEQPVTERLIFQSSVSAYELRYPAVTILRVSGLVGGRNFTVFQPGVHFRLANNRILWLHASEQPVDGGRLEVEYTYRERPAGLTDFNPGSVAGTLVRAFARELKLLYEQMDQAYRRAFIDEASGAGLDNVVALLGVTRNPPIQARGEVTFFLKAPTTRNVPIRAGTRVEDGSKRAYVTAAAGQIEPVITETSRAVDDAITVKNRVGSKGRAPEIEGVWRKLPNSEQISGDPLLAAATPGLLLGDDGRTLLLGGVAAAVRAALAAAGPLLVRYKSISVTVPVAAVEPGPAGNVNSGAVVIMPTPPPGVDGVVNEAPISGGQSAESDEQLRDRARHALERKGNATLDAIKFAVLDVDGVEGVEVVDNSADSSIPLGEVRVRYSGGDDAAVLAVVEQTRAAGILARLEKINEVLVGGVIYVLGALPAATGAAAAAAAATAAAALHDQVVETVAALLIGQPLSLRRLGALAYGVNGLAEVAEVQLTFRKADPLNPGAEITGPVTDPFLPAATELVRPDAANIAVTVLVRLAAARRAGTQADVDVSLLDTAGQAAQFKAFTVDLSVTLRARQANAPDQPPEVVGRFTRAATFVDSTQFLLRLTTADAPQLRTGGADAHDLNAPIEVTVSLAALGGIEAANTTVDFSPGGAPAPENAPAAPPTPRARSKSTRRRSPAPD